MYELDDQDLTSVVSLIKSKKLFRYQGKNIKGECDKFEDEFASYLNCPHSILLSSGTNALVAALLALKIGEGDEVIIPAYTFVATAFAVLQVGAVPVVANIDETLTISIDDIKNKISSKTKAIIPVHIDGLICNLDSLIEICNQNNIFLIEDAAQAIGGEYKGKKVGTFGQFGCFSLNVDKIISSGEGGIVVTKDPTLYERAFYIHDPACQFGPTKKGEFSIKGYAGLSMRVSEITGILARTQLRHLDKILEVLRHNKNILLNYVKDFNLAIPQGYCAIGECSISLHLTCNSIEQLQVIVPKLLKENIIGYPISCRLAHFVWDWGNYLYSDKRNPYGKSIKNYTFNKALYLPTLDIISRTIRIEIPYTNDLSIIRSNGDTLYKILSSIF